MGPRGGDGTVTPADPTTDEVREAIADLLREQEVGVVATLDDDGAPAAAFMHIAADGLRVYLHMYTITRTHAAIRRDPRIGCTVAHHPPGGMAGARHLHAVQIRGRATAVVDPAEIDLAVRCSREQFTWLRDSRMYDNVRRGVDAGRQAFVRIDPETALWTDNRVRMLWRQMVTFTADGRAVTGLSGYGGDPGAG